MGKGDGNEPSYTTAQYRPPGAVPLSPRAGTVAHSEYTRSMSPIRNTRNQHGRTRTAYFRGCRCAACVKAEAEYQRKRRQAIADGTWVGRTTPTTQEDTP